VLALLAALALAPPPEPTASDRPDVTNGTLTVPTGAWQAEVGVDAELAQRRSDSAPVALESTLRVGIHERAELRLLEGDLLEWITAAQDRHGTYIGGRTLRASTRAVDNVPLLEFSSKLRLRDDNVARHVPALGLQPSIALRPPGRAYRGLPVVGIVFIVSQPFGKLVILDMNATARVDGNLALRRVLSGYVSGSLGVQVHPRVLLYTEIVGVLAFASEEALILDGGLLVDVHHRVVFDLSARVAPVGTLRAAGVIAGMTAMLADGRRFRRRRAADSFADDGDEWGR